MVSPPSSQPVSKQVQQAREASAGWLIQRLAGALDKAMDRELERHGLTIQSFSVVMTVLEHDGLTQREIGSRFKAPAYAITRAIDGLENDGFLERRPHPSSRRANTVHATAKAQRLAPTLIAIIERVNKRLLADFDAQGQDEMRAGLRRMLRTNDLAKD